MINYHIYCNGTRKKYSTMSEALFVCRLLRAGGHKPIVFPVIDGGNAYQEWRSAMIRLELLEQDPA